MEGDARVSVGPLLHFWMLVGGVVVEDHVHDLEIDEAVVPLASRRLTRRRRALIAAG